jgi:tRNA threonylcarbamoyl adenosine modification protein YeaZ
LNAPSVRTCVLGIDTASPSPAVSLWMEDGGSIDEPLPGERQASERLLAAVEACLSRAGVRLSDCVRVAACSGPGSFTGVRVGLATAWGLARASGAALEPVSTLAVLAESARGRVGKKTAVAAAMDAGRGEVVWQPFDLTDARPRPLAEAVRAAPREAVRSAEALAIDIVCVPATLFAEVHASPAISAVTSVEPLARVLARLAGTASPRDRLETNGTSPLSAFYARPSAAQEKRGGP